MNTIDYTDLEQRNWNTLAKATLHGDKRAYRTLLGAIAPYIRNYLMGGLADPDWADDITQDALVSIHKSLKTYSPDRPFKPWMMSIVNFRRTDFLRSYYRSKENKESISGDALFLNAHVTNPQHAGEYKDIEAALNQLPAKQKRIFEMTKIQGYSIKEVADTMEMSESAVKVSAHRTMKKLQKQLQA